MITLEEFKKKGEQKGITILPETLSMYAVHILNHAESQSLNFFRDGIPDDLDPIEVNRKVDEYLDNRPMAVRR